MWDIQLHILADGILPKLANHCNFYETKWNVGAAMKLEIHNRKGEEVFVIAMRNMKVNISKVRESNIGITNLLLKFYIQQKY